MIDSDRPQPTPRSLTWLYATTAFASAGLLFVVQPMLARRLLPTLGGAPAVWTTCVLFFQAGLVGGYALAFAVAGLRRPRAEAAAFGVLLALGLAWLPLPLDVPGLDALPGSRSPAWGQLVLLGRWVGPPYVVLAATAPLLQHWFTRAGGQAGRDPYWLYAASNAGSLAALGAYPLAFEPNLAAAAQFRLWSLGLAGLAALTVFCAGWMLHARGHRDSPGPQRAGRATAGELAAWAALAGLPSVLMLGVTTHLTTDLAAVPLLWVVPLGLYLGSMILAFSTRGRRWGGLAAAPLPALLVATALVLGVGLVQLLLLPLHLVTMFVACYVLHLELAARRPGPDSLTSYYLAIAVGGALGGAFCALLAPWLFDRLLEYPLALVAVGLALALRGGKARDEARELATFALPVVAGGAAALLLANVGGVGESALGPPLTMLASGLAILAFRSPWRRPLRFALTFGALLAASGLTTGVNGRVIFRERNAFGTLAVTVAPDSGDHRLFHGSTLHGQQARAPSRRREPLTYFTRSGPVGDLFDRVAAREGRPMAVGVAGVGVGTLAAYAAPGDAWTFYEIDPAVIRIARDPALFTYLDDCEADRLDVVPGDARLSVAREPDGRFDLLILDAFGSDAVPIHLLTREAFALYRRKLRPGGRLVFNLSNRYLDLAPLIAGLAAEAGWSCRVRIDAGISPREAAEGKRASIWAVAAADPSTLGPLDARPAWMTPARRPDGRVWSDDFASILDFLRIGAPPSRLPPPP